MKIYHKIMVWYYGRLLNNSMYYEAKRYYFDKLLYHDNKLKKRFYNDNQ